MLKKLNAGIILSLILMVASSFTAFSQDSYTLAIKGEKGKLMKFSNDLGGTLNFTLDGLPIPNSKLSGENLAAKINIETYVDTLDANDKDAKFLIKLLVKNITLGGLLQLPDLGGISAGKAPEIELDLSPQGGIDGIQVRNLGLAAGGEGGAMKNMIPGMDNMGLDLTSLDSILPMITGLIPPIFPKDPVAVGDTWVQKVSDDNNPMPIFPKLVVNYKLVSVENNKAHIEFTTDGNYNADFLNSFLSMIPEIPMGSDNMSIKNVDLKMNWKMDGTMDFLIDQGTIEKMELGGTIRIKGGAKINFKHPDESTTPWEPKLDGSLDLTGGMTYAGTVARSDYEMLFPPDKDEEEAAEPAPAPKAKPAAKKTTKKPAAKKK